MHAVVSNTQHTDPDVLQLFSDVFVDDPLFVCEVAQTLLTAQPGGGDVRGRGSVTSHKQKQLHMLLGVGRVMDAVTLRHRLVEAAWETEILSKVCPSSLRYTLSISGKRDDQEVTCRSSHR